MATVTPIYTTTGGDFNGAGQSIALSGFADVLVFCGFGSAANPTTWGVRITKGGTDYDLTMCADGANSYVSAVVFYLLDAAALGSGAATITRIGGYVDGIGGTLYELRGVHNQAPEDTSVAVTSNGTSHSITLDTISNGALAMVAGASGDPSVTTVGGVLDQFVGGLYYFRGMAAAGTCGALGGHTASCTTSSGTPMRLAAAAFTVLGEVIPVDVGVTFAGLQDGSEVRLYERAHPQQWTIDLALATPASCDGAVLHYEVQGASAVTVHEVWIDLDDGSDAPYGATAWAAETGYTEADYATNGGRLYVCTATGTSAASGGPTGTGTAIEDGTCEWDYVTDYAWCDVATGNTVAQIAAAVEAVIDDDMDVTSSVTDAVISVANDLDGGPLAIPTATFPATVTVTQEGCDTVTGGTEIDGVESSTGDWVAGVTVASPRRVDVVIINPGWEPIRLENYLVTRDNATVPVSQRVDLNYSNPV